VHEPSYRDDRLGAVDGVLERMLERDVLPVRASFRDGAGNAWDRCWSCSSATTPTR